MSSPPPPNSRELWTIRATIANAVFNGVLVVLGVCFAITYFGQWGAMYDQTQLLRKSIELQSRATLAVSVDGPDNIGQARTVNFFIYTKNIGSSPATNVSDILLDKLIFSPLACPLFSDTHEQYMRHLTINPGEGPYYPVTVQLSDDDVARLQTSERVLYVYGVFRYWDTFRCRRAQFCLQWRPKEVCAISAVTDGRRGLSSCEFDVEQRQYDEDERCGMEPMPSNAKSRMEAILEALGTIIRGGASPSPRPKPMLQPHS